MSFLKVCEALELLQLRACWCGGRAVISGSGPREEEEASELNMLWRTRSLWHQCQIRWPWCWRKTILLVFFIKKSETDASLVCSSCCNHPGPLASSEGLLSDLYVKTPVENTEVCWLCVSPFNDNTILNLRPFNYLVEWLKVDHLECSAVLTLILMTHRWIFSSWRSSRVLLGE